MSEPFLSKCKQCGEPLDPRKASDGVLKCEVCGAIWTLPKVDSAALAFLRQGEHDLDTCKFEDAHVAYEKAAQLDPGEPEAHFGMALSEFRVQYLKDEVNGRLQPICHEISEKVFTEDKNYKKALELATLEQKKVYRRKGGEIDDIRDEFFALKKSGLDYDCFLCVKVTEEDGSRTRDYDRANEIYYHLKENDYQPFFSEREMKGRSGSNYEALILYALYTSECMLIVCSDEGYLQTKWVKNEYTRFLSMIANEEKERDAVTFAFYGKPIERLPGRNGKLQGIDLIKPDAYSRITEYVENHTPEAKKKREKAAREKQEAEAARDRELKELREKLAQMQAQQTNSAPISEANILELIRRAQEENADREAKQEAERKQREEAEQKQELKALKDQLAQLLENNRKAEEVKQQRKPEQNSAEAKRQLEVNRQPEEKKPQEAESKNRPNVVEKELSEAKRLYVAKTYKEAAEKFRSAAERGNAEAQFYLGSCYGKGDGVPQDFKKAAEWYTKAAERGNGKAQFYLGFYYELGDGVPQDFKKAAEWYTKAAEQGYSGAQYKLGFCYEQGHGVPQDFKKAAEWYTKAAEQGYAAAQYNLGNCYYNGWGMPNDKAKAVEWFKKAAAKGNASAQLKLAQLGQTNGEKSPRTDSAIRPAENGRKPEGAEKNRGTETQNTLTEKQDKYLAQCKIKNGVLEEYIGKDLTFTVPDGVTEIGAMAFGDCRQLTTVNFGKNCCLKKIGASAFSGCINLTSIPLPGSLTTIGESAFLGCKKLRTINLPDSVTSIGEAAFHDCSSLTVANIPKKMTQIAPWTFAGCTNLREISLYQNVTQIGMCAFINCSELKKVNIVDIAAWCRIRFIDSSSQPLSWGGYLYLNGAKVTDLKIPNGISMINEHAFYGYSWLNSIVFPSSLRTIKKSAFYNCGGLPTLTIPNSITLIEDDAFGGRGEAAKKVTIPKRFDTGFLHAGLKRIFGDQYKKISFTFT